METNTTEQNSSYGTPALYQLFIYNNWQQSQLQEVKTAIQWL